MKRSGRREKSGRENEEEQKNEEDDESVYPNPELLLRLVPGQNL